MPPRFSKLLKGNPLKDILNDARTVIRTGAEEMRDLTSAFRSEEARPISHEPPVGETACLNCVRDHLSTAASALGEATRFARSGSMGDREVARRTDIAEDECNIAERIDLEPRMLQTLSSEARQAAEWVLPKLRGLRHDIQNIRVLGDMEKTAAKASEIKTEYVKLFLRCETCGVYSLEEFLKQRRK